MIEGRHFREHRRKRPIHTMQTLDQWEAAAERRRILISVHERGAREATDSAQRAYNGHQAAEYRKSLAFVERQIEAYKNEHT